MGTPQETQQLKKTFIDHWRQYRHDLLNQIQLVQGYLQLGRLQDVQRYIDQIVVRARQEALLSRLSDPDLVYDLLTYNYQPRPFELDLEMALEAEDLDEIGKRENWIHLFKKLMELFESVYVPDEHESRQPLFVLVDRDEELLSIKAEWRGKWDWETGKVLIPALREKVLKEQGKLVEQLDAEQLLIEIRLPWPS